MSRNNCELTVSSHLYDQNRGIWARFMCWWSDLYRDPSEVAIIRRKYFEGAMYGLSYVTHPWPWHFFVPFVVLITHNSINFFLGKINVKILVIMPFCCLCLFTVEMEQRKTKRYPVDHLDAKYILTWFHCGRSALPPPSYQPHLPRRGWWFLSLPAGLLAKEPEVTGWLSYLKVL